MGVSGTEATKEFSLNNYICYTSISYYNTIYKTNHILTTYTENHSVLIYKLIEIICFNTNVYFFCKTLNVVSYKKHLLSYVVNQSLSENNYVLKNISDFMGPPIHLYELPTNELVIRSKHYF